jgi:hypothetical protein
MKQSQNKTKNNKVPVLGTKVSSKKKRSSKDNNSNPRFPQSIVAASGMPTMVGINLPASLYRRGGTAQQLTDIGGMEDNERVEFQDIYGTIVATVSSGNSAMNGNFYSNLTPLSVSPRLSSISATYQFYAFRELMITYVSAVGTSIAGQLTFGMSSEPDTQLSAPTSQQMAESTPTMTTSVGFPCSMKYVHNGTHVWSTSTTSETAFNYIQSTIGAVAFNCAQSTTFGRLFINGVIDFYKPTPILASPAMTLSQRVIFSKLTPELLAKVFKFLKDEEESEESFNHSLRKNSDVVSLDA